MNSEKTPVSLLQEYAMSQGIALPNYNMTQEDLTFKCIVTIGNITKTGTGANKKKAKQIAAEQALSVIYPYSKFSENYKKTDTTDGKISSKSRSDSTINSVGQLNELCSKNGKDYPVYESHFDGQSEFIVKCKLLKYVTEGKGKSKMDAKQNAAKDMLERAKSEIETSSIRKNPKLNKSDSEIIDLYKKLSTEKKDRRGSSEIYTYNNNIPQNTSSIRNLSMKEIQDETCLEDAISNLGITYKISEFQKDPLMLCLITNETKGKPSYTFIHCGSNFKETKLMLLRKSFEAICINFDII